MEAVRRRLDARTAAAIEGLEHHAMVDSTNTRLLEAPPPAAGRLRIATADHQTAGRGRRGRVWRAPPGACLCLSLAWRFGRAPASLPPLTLALGVAATRALRGLGIGSTALKWPNDLVADGGKLGGLLVEVHPRSREAVVAGIGVNVALPAEFDPGGAGWGRGPVSLADLGPAPRRAELAAALAEQWLPAMRQFEREGLAPFVAEWAGLDWLAGQRVSFEKDGRAVTGMAAGIDEDGAYRVRCGGEVIAVVSGELRPAPERGAGEREAAPAARRDESAPAAGERGS